MKNMYEIFDEFEAEKTKKGKVSVLEKNLSDILLKVLQYTFHPDYKWKIKEMPRDYKTPSTLQGISYGHLGTELRRIYMFQEGNETAEALAKIPHKQKQVLLQLLESLEPKEANVLIGIMKKDLGVKGLTYAFVKEHFPEMLP